MGQHKHNPTAIAAEKGEIASKPAKLGRRSREITECANQIRIGRKDWHTGRLFKNSY